MPAHRSYSFGEYTLDLTRGALLKGGADVKLRPKSFQVLQYLVERHGELVTKDELLDAVWGQTVVTEGSITQCLIDIRRAIGDESQRVLRTVPRRGYLFDARVVEADPAHAAQPQSLAPAPAPRDADISPDSTEAPDPETSPVPSRPRRPFTAAMVLATVAVVAVVAAFVSWRVANRGAAIETLARATTGQPARNAIAVLPFVNMSPEPDQEFFSDGISEEILNYLAQSDDFKVIARTSSFSFKGQNLGVAEIASRLNVAYVLEGSVRKSGHRVRITAQLVDAASSEPLWSETYDRDLDDAFAIQTDIAKRVADALEIKLTDASTGRAGYTPDAAAHERFLRAQFFYHRRAPGDIDLARQSYQEALSIDPGYARAWAGLAGVYGIQFSEGDVPVAVGLEKRREAVERGLASDPNLAETQMRAAQHFFETGDGQRAADHAAKAFLLDRNDPLVLSHFCTLLAWQDRFDDALRLESRMVTRDPFSLAVRINLANTLLAAGRLEDARTELLRAVELNPEWAPAVDVELTRILILERRYEEALQHVQGWPDSADRDQGLALIYDALGHRPEADDAIRALANGIGPGYAVRLAEVQAQRNNADEAFKWMTTAYEQLGDNPWLSTEWQWVLPLRFSPFLKPLYKDPRWAEMRVRGLPPGSQEALADLPEQLSR